MKFNSYAIDKELIDVLGQLNYIDATPIQEATIVYALRGTSFVAKSETGSGKTHAYLIPLINNLDSEINDVQAIIVEPTIELCLQCHNFILQIEKKYQRFKSYCFSSSLKNDLDSLNNLSLPSILILTPGRLKDILSSRAMSLKYIKTLVLDEVDMLLEGEQASEMISLIDKLHVNQKMIFTATMKEHQVTSLKKLFGISIFIDVNKKNYSSNNVKHHLVDIKHRPLDEAIETLLKFEKPYFTLVFASTKKLIKDLFEKLSIKGIKCAILSSDQSPRERKNIMNRINNGEYSLVLCSDLVSRGLDFNNVSHVISLDIPMNLDYYYHRAGRTGRYKNKGDSYIFYDDDLNIKSITTLQKKLTFDYLVLRNNGLFTDRAHTPRPRKKNTELEAEIKKEIAKVRSSKVKPGYKKKIKKAIKKAKDNHKRKIIMTNLKSKKKMIASEVIK